MEDNGGNGFADNGNGRDDKKGHIQKEEDEKEKTERQEEGREEGGAR